MEIMKILGCVKAGMGKKFTSYEYSKKNKYENDLKITTLPKELANMPTCLVCRKDNIPKIEEYLKKKIVLITRVFKLL